MIKNTHTYNGQILSRQRSGDSIPASTVSPHYNFGKLNAAIHSLQVVSTPWTPNNKKER